MSAFRFTPEGAEHIQRVLALGPGMMAEIRGALLSREALRRGVELPVHLAEHLDISEIDAWSAAMVVLNVSRLREAEHDGGAGLLEQLVEDGFSELADEPDLASAFLAMTAPSDEIWFAAKGERLQRDLHAQLLDLRSVVQLRPVFDPAREEILGAVSSAVWVLRFRDPEDGEGVLRLAVNGSDLEDIRRSLDEMEEKLSMMQERYAGSV